MKKVIELPCYGIRVFLNTIKDKDGNENTQGTIESDLHEAGVTDEVKYECSINTIESILLAHACAGIDITSPAYIEGIETAVDAICNFKIICNFND